MDPGPSKEFYQNSRAWFSPRSIFADSIFPALELGDVSFEISPRVILKLEQVKKPLSCVVVQHPS